MLVDEPVDPRRRILDAARGRLLGREIAETPQEVVEVVGVPGPSPARPWSSSSRSPRAAGSISSRASSAPRSSRSVSRSSESAGSSALGDRVGLVHVDRDPVEQQRLRERRRAVGVDGHHAIRRACTSPSTSLRPGTSNTSRRHSRVASSRIGNSGYARATCRSIIRVAAVARAACAVPAADGGAGAPGRRPGGRPT